MIGIIIKIFEDYTKDKIFSKLSKAKNFSSYTSFIQMTTAFKGVPVHTAGDFVKVGDKAPNFELVKGDLSSCTLNDFRGKNVVLNIFPSMDTGVCAASVRKFNVLAASLPNTVVLCISKDLPFAQSRFCLNEGIKNIIPLSDFRYTSKFSEDYGVLMTDGPLNGLTARCVIVLNQEHKVVYTEMVSEIAQEPNYDAAMAHLRK